MLRVGLSGGIGSGKSTVARTLAELGAKIIDSDVVAREVLAPGTPGLAQVAQRFGVEVIDADGGLNRPALAQIVFAEEPARQDLEAITHPLIAHRTTELFAEAGAREIVVHDVPLLVEKGMGPAYHLVLIVHTDEAQRVRRLVDDRGMSNADARARIRSQAQEPARRAAADVWLDNTGTATDLRRRVVDLWTQRLVPYEHGLHTHTPFGPSDDAVPVGDGPTRAGQAARLIARLRHALGDSRQRDLGIQHIAATANPPRSVADVIDVAILVEDLADIEPHLAVLAHAGFFEVPSAGSAERLLRGADPGQNTAIHVRTAG